MFTRIKFRFEYFILFYTVLNIIQAYFTELTGDEGYYWFYSLRLDWGYYDHPPLVGLLSSMGRILFPGTLGIRFFHVIISSAGLIAVFKMIPVTNRLYAAIIILALPLLNYLSFIVMPDSALFASTALLLIFYKKFLDRNTILYSVLLGIAVGISLYAKYHAILIVLFILLSNLKLLRNRNSYLALIVAILIYLPHLYWQIEHDLVTFKFHLIDRSSAFEIDNLIEYLCYQVMFIGPGLIFIPFVFKASDQFEKSLVYITIGTFLFFTLASIRGFVHLHWTSICIIPLIIMGSKYYSCSRRKKLLYVLVMPFIVLIILGRLYFMVNYIGKNNFTTDYYHNRDRWAYDIHKISDGIPVVFEDGRTGMREAPLYAFYSGDFSVALFPDKNRKSQYQLLNYEDSLQNKDVLYINPNLTTDYNELTTAMGKVVRYRRISEFSSFNKIRISCTVEAYMDSIHIIATIYNHRDVSLFFDENDSIFIELENETGNSFRMKEALLKINMIDPDSSKDMIFKLSDKYISEGKYLCKIGFDAGDTSPSVNYISTKMVLK